MSSLETSNLFELDTKGICLLCLRKCSSENTTSCSSRKFPPGERERIFQSFKMLMRYLNIDILQQCNFSSTFLQSVDGLQRDVQIVVKMCSVCLEIAEEFSQLYKQFEMIRLQLDECVQTLHHMMTTGEKSPERVTGYERAVKEASCWNPMQLFHASIADNLRKETLRKCSLKVEKLLPRVTVSKPISNVDKHDHLSSPPLSPHPICVITETKGDLEKDDFEGPMSMLKMETVFTDGTTMPLNDSLINEDSLASSNDDPLNGDVPSNINNRVECHYCKRFFSNANLRTHQQYAHTLQEYADRLPDGTTHTALKSAVDHCVRQHKKVPNSDGQTRYLCGYCTKDLRDTFNLKIHILGAHFHEIIIALANFKSPPPPAPTSRLQKLKLKTVATKRTGNLRFRRPKAGHTGPLYKCPVCHRDFTVLSCMKRHYKIYHTREGSNLYRCKFCDKSFITAFNLRTHVNSVHMFEAYQHQLPPGTSKDQLKATIHQIAKSQKREKGHYKNRDKPGIRCSYCGKVCNDAFFFKVHVLEHHLEEIVDRLEDFDPASVNSSTGGPAEEDQDVEFEFEGGNEEEDEQEMPIENFLNSTIMGYLLDGGEGGGGDQDQGQREGDTTVLNLNQDGGDGSTGNKDLFAGINGSSSQSGKPGRRSSTNTKPLTLKSLLGHEDEDEAMSDMPPVLDRYGVSSD